MQKLISTFIIGFYNHKFFITHLMYWNRNDQQSKILHFVKKKSKEVPVNTSYPRMFDTIDGYLDARISLSYVRYIITKEKNVIQKKIRNRIQGHGFHRL